MRNRKYKRISEKYPLAGQNLALTWTSPDYDNVIFNVANSTARWFIEHKLSDMSYINKYRKSSKNIGHFAQMVMASADSIGCAMTKYDDGNKNLFFVCDYSDGVMLNEPIYTTGKPCSKCKSGCTSKPYPGLCNSNEKDNLV